MSRNEVGEIKLEYHQGDRVRLTMDMDDPNPIYAGEEGTISCVDDAGQIHVNWDNGRSLALICGVDSFVKFR